AMVALELLVGSVRRETLDVCFDRVPSPKGDNAASPGRGAITVLQASRALINLAPSTEPERIGRCRSRKSYPRIAMVQSRKNRHGDDRSRPAPATRPTDCGSPQTKAAARGSVLTGRTSSLSVTL